ncbi:recombinase family protein, partial [Vibrio sp. 10N.222.55.E8]
KRGVAIKTVNQSQTFKYIEGDTMHNMTVDMMLTMLAGMAENERQARLASAQAGRDKLSQDEWKEKFQGRKTDTELHDKIIDELSQPKPLSLRKIAVRLGCGVSTVQRVKKIMGS